MWKRWNITVTMAALLAGVPWAAKAQTPINVSYQPAVYWALPYYLATEKGWWKELGLAPSFSVFPAGAPQVAAAQAGSWDVGGTGSVPAVLGAARSGLPTIGITNDESKANVMMVRGDKYAAFKANPQTLKGERILLTTNSTGDYAVRSCLKKYGIAFSDVQFINMGQAQIFRQSRPITAMSPAFGHRTIIRSRKRPKPRRFAAAPMLARSSPAPLSCAPTMPSKIRKMSRHILRYIYAAWDGPRRTPRKPTP